MVGIGTAEDVQTKKPHWENWDREFRAAVLDAAPNAIGAADLQLEQSNCGEDPLFTCPTFADIDADYLYGCLWKGHNIAYLWED